MENKTAEEHELNISGIIEYCRAIFDYQKILFHPSNERDVVDLLNELRRLNVEHKIEYSLRRQSYVATVICGESETSATHKNPLYAVSIAVALMVRSAKGEDPT
jgi:hypothetical protein